MNETVKRYIISTTETFAVSFFVTFFLMLDTALSTGNIDKTVILSISISAFLSASKVVVKYIRENILPKVLSYFKQK